MWESFVEAIRLSMFVTAQACSGSLGAGILLVSLTLRLLLLPLTVRLALRARRHQEKMASLAPELERLRERHAKDPGRYWQEASRVMREHGVRLADPAALLGMLIQAPVLYGLFAAVRKGVGTGVPFLWIKDLAKADLRLALLATLVTTVSIATASANGPNQNHMQAMMLVAVIGTGIFLWSTASTVALSVSAGAAVSMLQNYLVARGTRRPAL
jgi:YidC/Oxa1 family membrane protein insertase